VRHEDQRISNAYIIYAEIRERFYEQNPDTPNGVVVFRRPGEDFGEQGEKMF
jgi:hypothetical protein